MAFVVALTILVVLRAHRLALELEYLDRHTDR